MKNLILSSVILIFSAQAFALNCTVGENLLISDESAFLQLQKQSEKKPKDLLEMMEMLFKIQTLTGGLDINGSTLEIDLNRENTSMKMTMLTPDTENMEFDIDKFGDEFRNITYAEFQNVQGFFKAAAKSKKELSGKCKIKQGEKDVIQCGDAQSIMDIDTKNNVITGTLMQKMSDGKLHTLFMNKMSCQ